VTHPPPYSTLAGILLAFAAAAIVVRVAQAMLRRVVEALDIVGVENRAAVYARAKALVNGLAVLAYGIAALVSVSLALDRLGIIEPRWHPRQISRWLVTHGVNIVIIALCGFIVVRAANLTITHFQFKIGRRQAQTDLEWQRRATTLAGILTSLLTASVVFVVVLMTLRELTIDVVPIVTGAGIAGLAIGFGAQNLVRDVISGFFLILEDQVRVGDLARINGAGGTVEQINLRTIVLRDFEGAVQVFPNGTITSLANLSKNYAYAIVDVRIAYGENPDVVMEAMREVGDTLERDDAWRPFLLGAIEILGVESLAEAHATIRARMKAAPLTQDKVENELRRRMLTALVANGIKPYVS
jgi:moderate conductance mechanosensitive channel